MFRKILFIIYKFLYFLNFLFQKITNINFLLLLKDFIENDSYQSIKILNKDIIFFIPNLISKWRVDTFFSKEPETLEWIDSFDYQDKIIFWDIGANVGLYSIYAAIKHTDIEVVSFEPSTSNLRILSRNISINKLEKKIKINQFPLSDKENKYLIMKEHQFIEGGALNSFGENYDFEGKNYLSKQNYKIFGTSINYLLDNNFLSIPRYIKIDVDGIEHLILMGASKYLNNSKIKSISIELNENFKEQFEKVLSIMKNNNFKLKHKKHAKEFNTDQKFAKTYNYIFEK